MASGGGGSSSGQGSTGQTSSLSFVPALLANAFFGSGIGLDKGGFQMTGLGDYRPGGQIKGNRASSLVDPFGLSQVVQSNPYLGKNNPFSGAFNMFSPFSQIAQGGGGGGGGAGGGGGGGGGGLFSDFLNGTGISGAAGVAGDGLSGATNALTNSLSGSTDAMMKGMDMFAQNPAFGGLFDGLFGGGESPEDKARQAVAGRMNYSPDALGLGQGGILNPFDLVSNLTDLVNPETNPGLGGAMMGLEAGKMGQLLGNNLLFGGVNSTLNEGLQTGFKPDLQPVIDEAMRGFFNDMVPQMGQSNVAMQEGVGPFSTDLSGQITGGGADIASQLGALEVQNQNLAADRRGEMLGLSPLITDAMMNFGPNAGRNMMDLGEQFALQGTRGGRQATLLQLLAGQIPAGPIQSSQSSNKSKSGQGGIMA